MELIISNIDQNDRSKPLANPCSCCGYLTSARDPYQTYSMVEGRMSALGPLVGTVLNLSYPDKGYKLQFSVVCYLVHKDDPAVAEKAFTILTHSKIQNAGFKVAEPGQCVSAYIHDGTGRERDEIWVSKQVWRDLNTSADRNIRHDVGLMSISPIVHDRVALYEKEQIAEEEATTTKLRIKKAEIAADQERLKASRVKVRSA